MGQRVATLSLGQLNYDDIPQLAERAVAMAKASPEDPFAVLASEAQVAKDLPELDMCDETDSVTERLTEMAYQAEAAARDTKGISNSEGGSASQSHSRFISQDTWFFCWL